MNRLKTNENRILIVSTKVEIDCWATQRLTIIAEYKRIDLLRFFLRKTKYSF
jgi:hypothetical protein